MRFKDFFQDYDYQEQNGFFVNKGSIIVAGYYDDNGQIGAPRALFESKSRSGDTFYCNNNPLLVLLDDTTFDTQVCPFFEERMVRVFSFEKGMTLFLPTHETYVKVMSHGK